MPNRAGHVDQARPLRAVQRTRQRPGAQRDQVRRGTALQNCWITDMVPSLVYESDANNANGTVANLNNNVMMHHFVLINPRPSADTVCPGGLQGSLGERFFAAGNERSQMHLPSPYGYFNGTATSLEVDLSPREQGAPLRRTSASRWCTSTARRRRGRHAAVARHRRLPGLRVPGADRLLRHPRRLDLDGQRPDARDQRPPARRGHHERQLRALTTVRRRATASRCRPRSSVAPPATTSAPSRPTTRHRPTSPARRCAAPRAITAPRGRRHPGQRMARPPRHDELVRDQLPTCCPGRRRRHSRPVAPTRSRAIRSRPAR